MHGWMKNPTGSGLWQVYPNCAPATFSSSTSIWSFGKHTLPLCLASPTEGLPDLSEVAGRNCTPPLSLIGLKTLLWFQPFKADMPLGMLQYGGYTWLLDVRDSPIQARIGPSC